MSKYCIESMSDARKVGVVSVKKLPPRIIDKLQTCGYSGYEVHENRKYFVYYWFVWRHDGMWEIFINSDPDADEIPRELVKTLDGKDVEHVTCTFTTFSLLSNFNCTTEMFKFHT